MAKAKKKTAQKPAAKKSPAKKAAKPAAKKATAKTANKSSSKSAGKSSAKSAAKTVAKSKSAAQPKSAGKSASSAGKAKASGKASSKPAVSSQTSAKPAAKASSNIKWDQFLTPLDDRLIIEITSGEKMTAGGLYIPDTVTDTSGNYKGLVLVAGRGHRDDKGKIHPMDVQAGDTVLFSEFTGAKMDLMGKEVRILRESEILGIVTKK